MPAESSLEHRTEIVPLVPAQGEVAPRPGPFTPRVDPSEWRGAGKQDGAGRRGDSLVAFGGGAIFLVLAGFFAWLLYLAFR